MFLSDEKELDEIRKRYERRANETIVRKYDVFSPAVYLSKQERERKLLQLFKRHRLNHCLKEKKVLEIGCGSGGNLLQLLQFGFAAENLLGNELLEERVRSARQCLPEQITILAGDASALDLEENTFDIVYQSVVFSSILDDEFQMKLAEKMWRLTKIGGGILWYDFIFHAQGKNH